MNKTQIQSFGQSLRDMPVCPIEDGEEIIKFRNINGPDGRTRSIILVEKLGTTGGFGGTDSNTFYCDGKNLRGNWQRLSNTLRTSHGLSSMKGIVTDGKSKRYV